MQHNNGYTCNMFTVIYFKSFSTLVFKSVHELCSNFLNGIHDTDYILYPLPLKQVLTTLMESRVQLLSLILVANLS